MSRISTNAEAWEILFKELNILKRIKKDGHFIITANKINEYREARLMTKFDSSDALPKIFKNNKLSILPIASGEYMIANFCTYKSFEKINAEIEKIPSLDYIQSIDFNNINSESVAINCAYITEMLQDFLGEEKLLPTISGKMGSGEFNFYIETTNETKILVSVKNSRIEIDGGYEGINSLAIIEAKNLVSNDFMVRQLYYPYRIWKSKVSKKVRPIYLVYSNGIFDLYEYTFDEIENYSSSRLIKHKRYSIEDTNIELKDIEEILSKVAIIKEPNIPFPQANSFERVINLCELLLDNSQTKNYITDNYMFDKRQTDYYTRACMYLGLVQKEKNMDNKVIFSLTELGKSILSKKYKQRQLMLVSQILSHEVFNNILRQYFLDGVMPDDQSIVNNMKKCKLYNIKEDSTYIRRASTIKGWLEWIVGLL